MGNPDPNCIIEQLGDYTVIDLETTGLSPTWDVGIEVAAIRVRDHIVVAQFIELMNPHRELDDFFEELTGITNEMVSTAREESEVMRDFIEFIGDDVIVGHNVRFDLAFIQRAAEQLGIEWCDNKFIDTMRMSRRLYPDQQHHRLRDMVKQFGLAKTASHRAALDAEYTRQLYEILCKEMDQRPDKERLKRRNPSDLPSKGLERQEGYEVDKTAVYYGKEFAFTGTLERMTRREAMQIVVNHGGTCADSVTKTTNFLVLGNNDYVKSIKDEKSNKQKKAEKMKLKGLDIETISEDVFYRLFEI